MEKDEVKKRKLTIVCRCEEVTLEDIEKAIEDGCTSLEMLRKKLRIGMGRCQGRTCIPIVVRILARKLGKHPDEIGYPKFRAPLVPLPIKLFEKAKEEEHES